MAIDPVVTCQGYILHLALGSVEAIGSPAESGFLSIGHFWRRCVSLPPPARCARSSPSVCWRAVKGVPSKWTPFRHEGEPAY